MLAPDSVMELQMSSVLLRPQPCCDEDEESPLAQGGIVVGHPVCGLSTFLVAAFVGLVDNMLRFYTRPFET